MRRNAQNGCSHCGGSHENCPTEQARYNSEKGELGANCPHCGEWCGLGIESTDQFEAHPALPEDEDTMLCQNCNGGFDIKV